MNDDLVERVARSICDAAFKAAGIDRSGDWTRFENEARAAIAAMPGWQPIATAPRDETVVILCCPDAEFGAVIGFWSEEYSDWYDSEAASHKVSVLYGDPTHWRHLPDLPALSDPTPAPRDGGPP